MPVVEIITIGTELLLGEIQDTNTRYLARALRDAGLDLYRTTTVGDNVARIAQAVREALSRADVVITTGGLGPTVDDPTREAVAVAFDVHTEFRADLWQQIQERFHRYGRQPTENNRRQAFVPQGALAIENPVGTAPAFIMEQGPKSVICLPGVPREMETLLDRAVLPYLRRRFDLHATIKARVLHVASVGESQVDEWIGDLEKGSNPTVGLSAHPGQLDVRITAKAETPEEADRLIEAVAVEIYRRLGASVYGEDEARLEDVTLGILAQRGLRLAAFESGLGGELVRRLAKAQPEGIFLSGEVANEPVIPESIEARLRELTASHHADLVLGAALSPQGERQELQLVLLTGDGVQRSSRYYGGAPQNAPIWAANLAIDFIRIYAMGKTT